MGRRDGVMSSAVGGERRLGIGGWVGSRNGWGSRGERRPSIVGCVRNRDVWGSR